MPLINQPRFRDENTLPTQPLAPEQTLQEFAKPKETPDFLETTKAAFETYNTAGELYTYLSTGDLAAGEGEIDPEYSPWEEIEGTVYQHYAKNFVKTKNGADSILIKNQIDKELDNEDILRQSGALGAVMSIGAGLLDPVNIVGGVAGNTVAKAVIKGGLLRGTATGALSFLLAERGSDAVSRATRETYDPTLEDTAVNIGAATLLGGVLGTAGAKYLQGAPEATIAKAEKDFSEVDLNRIDQTGKLTGGSVGAMRTPEPVRPFSGETDLTISKGSNVISDLPVKAIKGLNLTPQTRLANSVSNTMRNIGTRLLRTGGTVYEGTAGAEGEALSQSAESIKGAIMSDFSKASYDYNNHYLAFKKAHAKKPTNITEDQFRRETIRVAEGDPAINPELEGDPSIKAAADILSSHLDNLGKQSVEQGLLKQETFDKRKDTYFPRQFDKQAVISNELRFRDIITQELHKTVRESDIKRLEKLNKNLEKGEKGPAEGSGQTYEEWLGTKEGKKFNKLSEEKSVLERYLQDPATSDKRITDSVDKLIDHITGGGIHMPEIGKIAITGALKGRTLNIPSRIIEDFLIRDPIYILDRYSQKVGGLIGLKQALGDDLIIEHDGGVHFKPEAEARIRKEYSDASKEAIAKTDSEYKAKLVKKGKELTADEAEKLKKLKSKKAIRLNSRMKRDIKDIISLFELLTGSGSRYHTDPSSLFHTALNNFKKLNFFTKMGGVTLSSLPDAARFVATYGFKKAVKGTKLLTKDISVNLTKAEKAQLRAFGQYSDATLKNSLINIADTGFTHGTSKFERVLNNGVKAFSKLTFIEAWNNHLTQTAAGLSMDGLTKAIKKFGKGEKLTEKEWTNINNVYRLSKDDLEGMAIEIDKYGGVSEDGYDFAYYDHWDNEDLANKFRIAIKEEAQRVIVTKDIGNVPLWFNTPLGSLISQFRSFNFAMTMKGIIPALQGLDRAPVQGFLSAAILGAFTVALKDLTAGRDIEKDPVKLLLKGIDQSGYMGIVADADGLANAFGLPSIAGLSYGRYNYTDKNILGAFTPTGGTLEDIQTALSALKTLSMNKRQIHALRKLIPFQNLFYLRGAFDKIEEEIND